MSNTITVDLPIAGGLDESTETTAGVRPQAMTNCIYRKVGGVRKRFGTTKINTSANVVPQDGARKPLPATAPTDTFVTGLFNAGNTLALQTDCSTYTYSAAQNALVRNDIAISLPATETAVAGYGKVGSQGDTSYTPRICGFDSDANATYQVLAWLEVSTDSGGTPVINLYSEVRAVATEEVVVPKFPIEALGTSGADSFVRVVYFNSKFLIVFTTNNGAAGTLKRTEFDPSTMQFATSVTAYGLTGAKSFDVSACTAGSYYSIAYGAIATSNVTLKTFNTSHSVVSTSTLTYGTGGTATQTTGIATYYSSGYIWVVQTGTSSSSVNLIVATVSAGTISSSSSKAVLDATTTASQLAVNATNNTTAFISWTIRSGTNQYSSFGIYNTTGAFPSGTSNLQTVYNADILSRPELITYGNNTYVVQLVLTSAFPSTTTTTGNISLVWWWNDPSGPGTVTASWVKPQVASVCRTRAASGNPVVVGAATLPPAGKLAQPSASTLVGAAAYSLDTGNYTSLVSYKWDLSSTLPSVNDSLGGLAYTPNGGCRTFDGTQINEAVPYDFPGMTVTWSASGGSLTAGAAYTFAACWAYTDKRGNTVRSAPFSVATAVGSANTNASVKVSSPQISDSVWNNRPALLELYMTPKNDDRLFLKRTVEVTPSTGTYTFAISDEPNASYRQLYTTGGVLDNVCPTGGTAIAAWQGRMWVGGTPDDTIWFSKEYVATERPGFNEGLTVQPFQGGRVVALQGLDQHLIVLKDSALYSITGQGPNDEGVDGAYSLPTLISDEVGCVDRNSVVYTPVGLVFRGPRGMYVLGPKLELTYVGRQVEDTLSSSVTITGAVVYPKDSQAWFFCNNGTVLVFDYLNMAWSKFNFANAAGSSITPVTGCVWNGDLYFADTALNIYKYDRSSYLDGGATFVQMVFMTSFVTPEGAADEGWHRVKSITVKLERLSSDECGTFVSSLTDYNTTATDSRTWTSAEMAALSGGATQRVLQVFPSTQKISAVAAYFYDNVASPTNSGQGYAIQSFGVEFVPTPRPTKRPSGNRK